MLSSNKLFYEYFMLTLLKRILLTSILIIAVTLLIFWKHFSFFFQLQNVFSTSKESLYERAPSTYDLKKSVNESPEANNVVKQENTGKGNKKSVLESVKDILGLYKNPIFVLICFCMCIYVLTFIPIMTSVVDYTKDKGLPETTGKYLVHAMAFGDILGKYWIVANGLKMSQIIKNNNIESTGAKITTTTLYVDISSTPCA